MAPYLLTILTVIRILSVCAVRRRRIKFINSTGFAYTIQTWFKRIDSGWTWSPGIRRFHLNQIQRRHASMGIKIVATGDTPRQCVLQNPPSFRPWRAFAALVTKSYLIIFKMSGDKDDFKHRTAFLRFFDDTNFWRPYNAERHSFLIPGLVGELDDPSTGTDVVKDTSSPSRGSGSSFRYITFSVNSVTSFQWINFRIGQGTKAFSVKFRLSFRAKNYLGRQSQGCHSQGKTYLPRHWGAH